MKKLLFLLAVPLLCWTCSTDLDVLDNWKETTVVYCLLDQTQSTQYIRIEKAFLGPDNALSMAQQFDSINYIHSLSVTVDALDNNGNVVMSYSTSDQTVRPITTDTVPKEYGTFAGPVVLYKFDTPPSDPSRALNPNYKYRLTVINGSGISVTSTTSLVQTFTISSPNLASPVSFNPTASSTTIDIKWVGVSTSVIYQPSIQFYYTEYYVNGDSAQLVTPELMLESVVPASDALTTMMDRTMEKMAFYRLVANSILPDANVVKRRADHVQINVYGGSQELKDYIDINGASNSVAQEHPLYTNITNGYGLFAARASARRPGNLPYTYFLSQKSIDGDPTQNPPFKGLSTNPLTCSLMFESWDHSNVPGCQ